MSEVIFQINRNMSNAQRQEALSVSDITVPHENKKEKMSEYCNNIKEAELARHEEIKEHERINFMKSIANSVDHER